MYRGKVIRSFVDRFTRDLHVAGGTYRSADLGRMEQLADMGYIEFTAPAEPSEPGEDDLRPLGGGWYMLPSGRKVQGKAAALAAVGEE